MDSGHTFYFDEETYRILREMAEDHGCEPKHELGAVVAKAYFCWKIEKKMKEDISNENESC